MSISVDIVIPVLDEEDALEENIIIVLEYIDKHVDDEYQCQIIIADNGSTDSTPRIATGLVKSFPGKVAYQRVDSRGVGLALKTTWSESKSRIIGYMDLDLATDLRHLPEALDAIANKDFDVVYGSRLHKLSKVSSRSIKREITSRLFNMILRKYLGVTFSDGMCGFKFIKREILPFLLQGGAKSDGWFFCTELLVVAEWNNYKLFELPVNWTDSPGSKVKIAKLSLEYLKAMQNIRSYKELSIEGD